MSSNKRVAVVTGANRGIGYEVARELAKQNYQVILTARDRQKGEQACAKLKNENLDVSFFLLDVTNSASIHDLSEYLLNRCGRLDVLVNNAGVLLDRVEGQKAISVWDTSIETLRATF